VKILTVDIETYSEADLSKTGVYKYAGDPSFEILLFGYAFDDEPVQVIDLTEEALPLKVKKALTDPNIKKIAHNAAFERTCLAAYTGMSMPPSQWLCTMVYALSLGLPAGLKDVGEVLKLDIKKDKIGKSLINYFSKPCKPTKINGGRTRNFSEHAPDKWNQYMHYCQLDVETERELHQRLNKMPLLESEWELWQLDQKINDAGVKLETNLVKNAIELNNKISDILFEDAKKLTGLENPNSVAQLKRWLELQGVEVESLDKKAVQVVLKETDVDEVIKVLEIRQQLSKSSIKKYEAMNNCMNHGNRARGLFQFYGASKTGRWAGRRIQLQNLPQNHLDDLEIARQMLVDGDFKGLCDKYDNIPNVLSNLIRTAIVPGEGNKFLVSDFSAIEARVLSWFAGEKWRLEVFRTHGKIYEASASSMFNVPIESIDKSSPLRQKGKIAELALGYGGGVGALIRMGALEQGLKEDELQPLVDAWRRANPNIVKLWYALGDAAFRTVRTKEITNIKMGIQFSYERGILFMRLPSGRRLAYVKPHICLNKKGYDELCYMSQNMGSWVSTKIWSGQWAENLVQAVSRDLLAEAMKRVDKSGYKIVGHVHDEIITEVPINSGLTIEDLNGIMRVVPKWANDLPLNADGFESTFYHK
jgi:DNA polymerase